MNNNLTQFNLDFGTKPTTDIPTTPEFLEIDPSVILDDFAEAYFYELYRRNPLKMESILKQYSNQEEFIKDLNEYFQGLLKIRVESVEEKCKNWRKAKQLVIPAWIQFTISQIGRFVDYDYGLYIIPKFDYHYDIQKLLEFSFILESFKVDGISLFKDAFPRSKDGNKEVMSMAIVNDYVKSITKEAHPIASYVVAFLGAKLQQQCAIESLYRVRYDDIGFIKAMLINESSIY